MSDADRVGLAFVAESSYGEVPSGPPTLQDLRFTGESLLQQTSSVSSTEIRADRQVPDVIRTSISAQGGINLELSYDAYDDFLRGALQSSAWSSVETVGPIITLSTTAPDTISDSGSGLAALDVGQWIKVSGFTTAANNGYFKIATVAAGVITVEQQTIESEVAGDTVTIVEGAQVVNGTTLESYVIEREYSDLTNIWAYYLGMSIDSFSLNVAIEALITGAFNFVGKNETSGVATVGDGSNTAATTKEVMNTVDHVDAILEGGASLPVTGFNFEQANNLRARLQVATLGAISLGSGKVAVTGGLQAYFTTAALANKYLGDTATSLALVVQDDAGNAYVFDFPKAKLTSGTRNAQGENTDVIVDFGFTAYMHPTELVTVRIAKFAA